ncbi:hypothetical protein [Mesorhizobium sp. Mes31]|uniref:hypothetical protein n=1 Tax=Mesorhizobium sp. Mes31 TaxID=2926017 RepID=UPI0021175878|nr:hypothetical protein [Mesorhizobium sp. Mes31]
MIDKEAMVGRAVKHVIIATVLAGALAGMMGCTSIVPRAEPTLTTKHRTKVVRTTTTPKVIKQKKVTARKVVKPVEDEPPPVVAPLGGGSGGGGTGGGAGGW